ncbi:hypothetical protein EVAR_54749_1 [Eumeta japonica]|uniref:Uncharacterized protein n=1 Tax=Eumeta variegata TaxID=151549 RepID=A0A4C1YV56_EUMVA|nr:hypothetical protein EVAR_54749_1 [Eumeta japonica]
MALISIYICKYPVHLPTHYIETLEFALMSGDAAALSLILKGSSFMTSSRVRSYLSSGHDYGGCARGAVGAIIVLVKFFLSRRSDAVDVMCRRRTMGTLSEAGSIYNFELRVRVVDLRPDAPRCIHGGLCNRLSPVAALHHSWTSATSGLRGLFLITCRQNLFVCEAPSGARPSAVADVADA